MITPKANAKLMSKVLFGLTKDKIDTITTLIAAPNVLITDITKKGELVLKHLKIENLF